MKAKDVLNNEERQPSGKFSLPYHSMGSIYHGLLHSWVSVSS